MASYQKYDKRRSFLLQKYREFDCAERVYEHLAQFSVRHAEMLVGNVE